MRKLFGLGVQGFAPGIDGGRDARFSGTAAQFPSAAAPWTGVTIGQAKHTHDTNVHYSDPSFSGDTQNSVLGKEVCRIKKLLDAGELDFYILFANRRLGGTSEESVRNFISAKTGLAKDRIFLAGVEFLDDLLRRYPDVVESARIDPVEGPLLVSSADLAEVILAIAETLDGDLEAVSLGVTDRVSYDEKNRVNGMTPQFARRLSSNYLRYTQSIEDFLADPANDEVRTQYDAAVEDFQLKIIEKRGTFASFDAVFNHLVDLMVGRDSVLSRNRRLLRAVLFYMYWHCDIGEVPSAEAN